LHSRYLVIDFHGGPSNDALTPYLALETTTSLVSCELQGGGLSPLALTAKPDFLTFKTKKAKSFWTWLLRLKILFWLDSIYIV
jgi:hypothetical protein